VLPRIAICGTARNAERSLPESLRAIERIRQVAVDCHVAIVTNDNDDSTASILTSWSGGGRASTVIVRDGLAASHPDRIDRIAAARNFYLDELRRQGASYDLLVVLDLDGPNDRLMPEHIVSGLAKAPADWVGIFANQGTAYYDLYALRHPSWVRGDVWLDVANASAWVRAPIFRAADQLVGGRIGRRVWRGMVRKHVHDLQYRIAPTHPPIGVQSAFGGLGIYRYDAALSAQYDGRTKSGEQICEHVTFNRLARSRGGSFYICPSMLNGAPQEHLGPGSGAPFPRRLS
jgi:hypothetical protein